MAATGVAMIELVDRLVDHVNPYLLSDFAVCAELAMIGVWNAPATASDTVFIAPANAAASMTRWQAAFVPETTMLSGHKRLDICSTSPWADSRHNCSPIYLCERRAWLPTDGHRGLAD